MKFATAAMRSLLPLADLDPKVVVFKLPDHTPCRRCGQCDAVMSGDPSKPGLYIVLTKWHAGHMSDPLPPERPFHHSAIGNAVGR